MITAEQFLEALARTESMNNSSALGDYDGLHNPHALGRWQLHIDRTIDLAKRYACWPTLGESYDSWQRRLMTAFFEEYRARKTPVEMACRHHLGHWVDPKDDAAYARRFLCYCPTPPAA